MTTSRHQKKIASDIMTPEPVCASPHTTLRELASTLQDFEISGVPVIDSQERLCGVISKSDLVRRAADPTADLEPRSVLDLLGGERSQDTDADDEGTGGLGECEHLVEDFMTIDPVTAPPDEPVRSLAHKMIQGHIHRVIIVDSDFHPIGIVTALDLLRLAYPAGANAGD